ncbi:MAG: N-acetylmuramoyl-L-alanine amidase [Tumebacillaceae bacterium]
MVKSWKTTVVMTALSVALGATISAPAFAEKGGQNVAVTPEVQAVPTDSVAGLDAAFAAATKEFGVPVEVLMAVSYNQTRWQSHGGEPSKNNGFGVMHLVDNNMQKKTLVEAAKALGVSKQDLQKDSTLNIRGGAYILASLQKGLGKELTSNPNEWYEAVAAYEQAKDVKLAKLFADDVFAIIKSGTAITTADGATLSLQANPFLQPNTGKYATVSGITIESTDYGPAIWNAANSANYQVASRTAADINKVIIHDTEGSYSGTISWFQNATSSVSAHYVVRSSDGQITQMVREKDIAWHARTFNSSSVGIEHEGYANQTGWYTTAMYNASAALVSAICDKYGIAKTRNNILAHSDLYGNTHTDPGKNWDWNYYMSKVTGVTKNYTVVTVDDSNFENSGFTFYGPSTYWRPVTGYGIHNQINWTNGNGSTLSNYGIWRPNIPTAGQYEVKVFVPSKYAATTNAKYEIHYNGGVITKPISQLDYSDQWVSLGTYSFAAGTTGYVKMGDNTGDTVNIAFDAIKFMAK